jgi:hypothetical protein
MSRTIRPPYPDPEPSLSGVLLSSRARMCLKLLRRFIIPNARMGSVIGKGGSKIKEIQEASGARLQASEAMLPGSSEVGALASLHSILIEPLLP